MRFDQFIVEAGKVKDAAVAWLTDFVDSRIERAIEDCENKTADELINKGVLEELKELRDAVDSLEGFRSRTLLECSDYEARFDDIEDTQDRLQGRLNTLANVSCNKEEVAGLARLEMGKAASSLIQLLQQRLK